MSGVTLLVIALGIIGLAFLVARLDVVLDRISRRLTELEAAETRRKRERKP